MKNFEDNNRVVYRVATSGMRTPWLVVLANDEWKLAPANRKQKAVIFGDPDKRTRLARLERWFKSLPEQEQFLVLIIKPGGVDSYRLVRASVDLRIADFGVDLIRPDATVIDPETGAAIQ